MTEPEGSCAATVRVEAGVNILCASKEGRQDAVNKRKPEPR